MSGALSAAVGLAGILFCVGAVYAIASALSSVLPKKAAYRLRTHLSVGSALCLSGIAAMLYQAQLPTYEVEGRIDLAQVLPKGKGQQIYLTIQAHSGEEINLKANGTSPYFNPGQEVVVQYQPTSGDVLNARFLSAGGIEEAEFRGAATWWPYLPLLIGGVVLIGVGIRGNRRDRECASSS